MSGGPGSRAVGGMGIVVLCFVGSALLRLAENGQAFAQEIGTIAPDPPAEPAAAPAAAEGLLAAIAERETQLMQRETELADRAQTLNVAETKLAEQLAAFETARRALEDTLALADKAAERDIERMTTVYENMKPDEAARIFEQMDVTFAAGLLVRMRPEIAAQVLTGMEAATAYAVTLTIASRNAGVPKE